MMPLRRAISILALSWAVLLPGGAMAVQTLRVLTWPGYADPELVKGFEQRTKSRVEVTIIDSDEVLWEKVGSGNTSKFDVFAVNTAELQRYIKQGLVSPINRQAIPNTSLQQARFRDPANIPGLMHAGKTYAVPYTYAEMGLIFDRSQIREAPRSIAALWDVRLRGKVLVYQSAAHNFSLAAQSLGLASPFRIGEQQWPSLVERLIALRRNLLTVYTQPEESVELFKNKGAALMLANYGSQQLQLLKSAGVDVGYVIPEEGALAWLDCWAIAADSPSKALAESWINYLLEARAGEILTMRQGLANTTSPSPFHTADDRLIWLEPVEDTERRSLFWSRIVSGDRLSRVLAP